MEGLGNRSGTEPKKQVLTKDEGRYITLIHNNK